MNAIDEKILSKGHDFIPFTKIMEIAEMIKSKYYFSSPGFWIYKAFEFGFVYGKRAERTKRKKTAQADT